MWCLLVGAVVSVGPESEEDIEKLLQSLTLEEKVGQMAQLGIDDFVDSATDEVIDDYAYKAIVQYKIGSILNTYNLVAHPRNVWATIQASLAKYAGQTDKQIPILYGLDSIHGATFVSNSTLFPQEIGMAATFNTTLAREGSRVSAYETRAASVPWTFAPVADLGLDPRWSRLWEDYGEDPYLGAQMAAAMVEGFQGGDGQKVDPNHVAACLKHYIGYGNPISGKDRTPAVIPELYLREYHLPGFEAGVKAGALTVMVNSALINGIPVHMNKFLLTTLLKEELGYDGLVVTDWGDIDNIYRRDKVAATPKEAVRLAINAGIDMSMIPYDLQFCDYLRELVLEGSVSEDRINDAVRRILRVKLRLDLWNVPTTKSEEYPNFNSDANKEAARNAVRESITLLRNTGNVLPLSATGGNVLLVGPNADTLRALTGGWSYGWQGLDAETFTRGVYPSVKEAISTRIGAAKLQYIPGVSYNNKGNYWEDYKDQFDEAVTAAGQAGLQAIVAVVGENSYTEKPGDLQDLALSKNQTALVAAIKAAKGANVPLVLVLNGGRPRVIETIQDGTEAILEIYLPGNHGGEVLAEVLFGDTNPSGKLPYTYPWYPHSLVPYWHKYSEEQVAQEGTYNYESDWSPLFEFGFGLSYTTFSYSALTLSPTNWNPDNEAPLTVTVTVRNTGTRAGKETVLLFTSDLYASVAPDVKRLRKFEKISLAGGQAQQVAFQLTAKDLSFINTENKRVTEAGDFKITVGVGRDAPSSTISVAKDYAF